MSKPSGSFEFEFKSTNEMGCCCCWHASSSVTCPEDELVVSSGELEEPGFCLASAPADVEGIDNEIVADFPERLGSSAATAADV